MRQGLLTFFELFALSGLVIAEPLFGMLRDGSANLVSFVLTRRDLWVVTLTLILLPAAVLIAIIEVAGRSSSSHDLLAALTLGAFCGLFVIPVLKESTTWTRAPIVVSAVVAFAIVAALLWQWPFLALVFLPVALVPINFAARFVRAERVRRA